MFTQPKNKLENTSTPKRRRLGTGRVLRKNLKIFDKENGFKSPKNRPASPFERPDDPPLPCNQIEFLCDSGNTSCASEDIPCSPGVLDCSIVKKSQKWESLVVSKDLNTIINKFTQETAKEMAEINNISDEMFQSKLEQEFSQSNNGNQSLFTSGCEKHFRENIEESFDAINRSINELDQKESENNESGLFDTKDSFLLDIRETGIVQGELEKETKKVNVNNYNNGDNFYGLPIVTKNLFKSLRNIDRFYDWQEECLNLPAIKERRNLIYALPTSGGKTLVAEVLMLREVLCRKKNALFILPFVAIVQEKIYSLSPFAVKLNFLVEEYAAGKGHIPPKRRRTKTSIYIATIEKGLALVRSLLEENRLHELGLCVVDELHLIGEAGRGATLETLLTTIIFASKSTQIVGMSATIGNLPELASYLNADVFERDFRPVKLQEYVKLGDMLHTVNWTDGLEVTPHKQLVYDYSEAGLALDPDQLGGLVGDVVPRASCLIFCATKRNAENVTALLCKLQRREMLSHRPTERATLSSQLAAEGSSVGLQRAVRCGLAYHHAGLSSDERALIEQAFRSGVISALCCTSTLAAGVNLPAERVIIRAPRTGKEFLTLASYRQMVGRAGRAGHSCVGESIIICPSTDWPQLRAVLSGGLCAAKSVLRNSIPEFMLSAVALGLACDRKGLRKFLGTTLLANSEDVSQQDLKQLCDDSLRSLIQNGAIDVKSVHQDESNMAVNDRVIYNDSELDVSKIGKAAIKGCIDLSIAKQLEKDLQIASQSLVVMGSLHLLYLLTATAAVGLKPDYRLIYHLYCNLDEEGIRTAKILGITEVNAIRMMTGKPITNVPETVLSRFYLALMLHDLWKQMPFTEVAEKYNTSRGALQTLLTTVSSFALSALRFAECVERLWAFRALFAELAPRLQHCAAPELTQLMELPAVKKARALQLMRAGYKKIEDLAKASVDELMSSVTYLSRSAATHLVSAARMMLIEKVENLRAEAEEVMDGLKIN